MLKKQYDHLVDRYGEFLLRHRGIELRTQGTYRLEVRRFLQWMQDRRIQISGLRAENIQEYISASLKERRARSTKKRVTQVLRGFFRFLF